ncbi:MAG: helix-turn-helix domain-containing protein [Thermomicrobiales bacterium]
MQPFNATLRDLIRRSAKSVNEVAAHADVDPTYLRRLLSGEKRNPSVITLIKLYGGIVGCSERFQADPTLVHAFSELLLSASSQAVVDSVTGNHRPAR